MPLALWDVADRQVVVSFGMGGAAVAFHPSGKRLASASLVQTIRLWDLDSRRLTAELKGHQDAVTCVAYSPGGRLLASGSDDRTVRLWDADTGACEAVATLDTQIKALCFSPDGRFLYTGNGNTSCYQLDVQLLQLVGTASGDPGKHGGRSLQFAIQFACTRAAI